MVVWDAQPQTASSDAKECADQGPMGWGYGWCGADGRDLTWHSVEQCWVAWGGVTWSGIGALWGGGIRWCKMVLDTMLRSVRPYGHGRTASQIIY